jgi:hypothetical protein
MDDDYADALDLDDQDDEPDWKDYDAEYYERLMGPPKEEPDCHVSGCYDSSFTRNGKPCPSCNPPGWLIRWWAISSTLTAPYRWLRRRLRPRPRYDDDSPF